MSMKDIIKAALAEQPSTVKELVQNELYNRAMVAVDEMRTQIAPGLFNESNQLPVSVQQKLKNGKTSLNEQEKY